jgi:hypothetical protein
LKSQPLSELTDYLGVPDELIPEFRSGEKAKVFSGAYCSSNGNWNRQRAVSLLKTAANYSKTWTEESAGSL